MRAPRPPAAARLWISGEASRADVQHWRARSSAVLTGAGTVRIDDPRLDVRLDYGPWVRQPLRVRARSSPQLPADRASIPRRGRPGVRGAGCAAAGRLVAALGRPFAWSACRGRSRGSTCTPSSRGLTALEVNELLVECGPRSPARFLAGASGRRTDPVRRTRAARRRCGAAHRAHAALEAPVAPLAFDIVEHRAFRRRPAPDSTAARRRSSAEG